MTKLHHGCLSGAQRNYRAPGAKLKPRDAYDAHRAAHRKCTARQLRKDDAIETNVMGWPDPAYTTQPERRIERLKSQVSTRAFKDVVHRVNIATSHAPTGDCALYVHGAARQRLVNAILAHVRLQYMIEHDRQLHRWAA